MININEREVGNCPHLDSEMVDFHFRMLTWSVFVRLQFPLVGVGCGVVAVGININMWDSLSSSSEGNVPFTRNYVLLTSHFF
jgi:hypothetical protein